MCPSVRLEPPAPETQPVPPQENPLAQQEKTEAPPSPQNPAQENSGSSVQQPVQSSQAQQIQKANTNLGDETSAPPVQPPPTDVKQTSTDAKQTSNTTENERPIDPVLEGE